MKKRQLISLKKIFTNINKHFNNKLGTTCVIPKFNNHFINTLPCHQFKHFSTCTFNFNKNNISKHAESVGNITGRRPMEVYKELIKKEVLSEDPRQLELIKRLDKLYEQLIGYDIKSARQIIADYIANTNNNNNNDDDDNIILSTTSTKNIVFDPKKISREIKPHPPSLPKSLYIYGDVGCGKTMLMDLFYQCLPIHKKLRIHFNSFMIDFHTKMHQLSKINKDGNANMEKLMDEIADKYILLCFDEFQVTDIADAMILKRLFEGLLNRGVVVVKTSNRKPESLYEGGINREAFISFIDVVNLKYDVFDMEAVNDYRLSSKNKSTNVYYTPANKENELKLEALFKILIQGCEPEPYPIMVMNRVITIPKAARGVAFCTFDFLCKQARSAVDYIGICKEFHTIILHGIPVFNNSNRDHMRRFITLVDELYQHRVKLICTAEKPVEELLNFSESETYDEVFAFDRTISRLMEMRSKEYLMSHHVTLSTQKNIYQHVA
ncbi:hypothetical protein ABK040_002134 [Willaertia magna]